MTKEDKICVHAWKGLYVTPLSEAGMCCIQFPLLNKIDSQTDVKNIRKQEEWNSVRESMLRGEEHPSCQSCWAVEKEKNVNSYRQSFNTVYPKEYERIKQLNSDKLYDDKLMFIDIRQTNVCNMKCLSCGPVYSSLWGVEEYKRNNGLTYSNGEPYDKKFSKNGVVCVENDQFEDYILDNIDHVVQIYFAGGEPMLNPLHWKILEKLDRLQRYDTHIFYNTNLLKLSYNGKHIYDYWNKFTNWSAGCSVDAVGARAEYVRTGTKWPTIDKHIKELQFKYPQVCHIDTTVSALSVGGLKDLIIYCRDQNIKQRWSNTIVKPDHLRLDILPRDYRQHIYHDIEKMFEDHTEKIYPLKFDWAGTLRHFKVAMLDSDATDDVKYEFKRFIESKDKLRNTDIFSSCPEFKDLWPKI
tara:strand:- start:852 stop:2084 length:1233 start_codon:yes stop_codon:yes gene_type:complete